MGEASSVWPLLTQDSLLGDDSAVAVASGMNKTAEAWAGMFAIKNHK